MADEDRIKVWASWDDSLPRLVTEMTRGEWAAGKEIPRLPVLSWGEASEARSREDAWMQRAAQELFDNSDRSAWDPAPPDILKILYKCRAGSA